MTAVIMNHVIKEVTMNETQRKTEKQTHKNGEKGSGGCVHLEAAVAKWL